jgi:simple sugar transport system ATP-binding protein
VSHKLEEIDALCDRVTILRRGAVTGEEAAPFHIPRLLELMFDQTQAKDPVFERGTPGEPRFGFWKVSAMGERTGLQDCSVQLHQGEVTALAGLAGSGQGVFLRLAAGLRQPQSGRLSMPAGQQSNHHLAFRRAGGVFLPADRLHEGLIPGFTIQDHFALAQAAAMDQASRLARDAIDEFQIKGTPDTPVESLSGGNQQRLQLALIPPDANFILLENPTRGLDVASGERVWRYLRRQYRDATIVFSSAELDEILAVADRVLVFFNGRLVRDLNIDLVEYEDIAAAMTGH